MKRFVLPIGTAIADDVRDTSTNCTPEPGGLKTLGDLLDIWETNPPRSFSMLRTTCSKLGDYLQVQADQITIDSVSDTRDGFRTFLEGRKYKKNSIRSYVNFTRILLGRARELGWQPDEAVPEAWRGVLALAGEKRLTDIVRHLARIRKTPQDAIVDDVESWGQAKVRQGAAHRYMRNKKTQFWRLLRDCGCTVQTPPYLLRKKNYGIPVQQLPVGIRGEVMELLNWKQALYAPGRPKYGRHRATTARNLQQVTCALCGFAINIRGEVNFTSLSQIVTEPIVSAYAAWCLNVRGIKSGSLHHNLRLLFAAMLQHPSYKSMDLSWCQPLLDGLPLEPRSELKKRKSARYLEYDVLESIPAKIRAGWGAAAKKGAGHVARLVMAELLMKWLPTLPWRQRNIRECRIGGPAPNLFKSRIPPFSDIDTPEWVKQEVSANPAAEFWQFHFSPEETKTGIEVHALLPRQLIGLLEEFLRDHRPRLLHGADPGTLFVNQAGTPMSKDQVTETVSDLTFQHGGRRMNPHLYRDVVAYSWLKAHPTDFLSLSKLLWHASPNITIKTYGGRFNESNGSTAMESWLDERAANSK